MNKKHLNRGAFYFEGKAFLIKPIYTARMSFFKPLVKTILVSSILFFALVYLGMKYHWIGFNQNDKDKNVELKIPERTQMLGSKNAITDKEEKNFHPQIIQTVRSSSLVINMNKEQVTESCTQLLRKKMTDIDLLELAIGDCVISNYRDSIF